MSKIPRMAAQSGVCLNAIMLTTVTSTIPNPTQIALAIPIGMVFKQVLRQ